MRKAVRVWWKCFKETKRFFGLRRAIKIELRNISPLRMLDDLYYAIRHRTFDKFHVVKLDLKPGYYDIDTRLVHANFCLLTQFVEKEEPFKVIDWDSDDEHKHAAAEIKELYKWWKEVYPNYDKNDPINADDVKFPEREHIPYEYDEEGDVVYYEWKVKAGQEEIDKKFTEVCKVHREYEKKTFEETQENLIRLIKIRPYLWT